MRRPHRFIAILLCLIAASQAIAANLHWTGNAQNVKQVQTIAVSGTWATGDTATITCNKKSVTTTIGAAVTTTDVAAAIAAAINATDATDDVIGTESRNVGGQEIPEFTEIVASSSSSTITFKSTTAGVPFTITRSESTAGDGALGAVTTVTSATGKNWLSNADNYDTASLPADNDTLYIDSGSVSILYALDYFRTNNIDLTIIVTGNYLGQIGNPADNPAGYREYRTPLYFYYRGGSKSLKFLPGTTSSTGQGNCWIDLQDQAGVNVISTAKRGSGSSPTVFLAGGDTSSEMGDWVITDGLIHIDPDDAPQSSGKSAFVTSLAIGSISTLNGSGPVVYIGSRTRLYPSGSYGALDVHSGDTHIACALSSGLAGDHVTITEYGGNLYLEADAIGPFITVNAGATLYQVGGGQQTEDVRVNGGTLDYTRGTTDQEIVNLEIYAGSTIRDPGGRLGETGIELKGCTVTDVTLQLAPNYNVTFAP